MRAWRLNLCLSRKFWHVFLLHVCGMKGNWDWKRNKFGQSFALVLGSFYCGNTFCWHEIFFNLPLKCWSLVWTFYLGAFKMLLWVGDDIKHNRLRERRDYFNFLEELWKAKKIRVFKTRVIFLWFNGKFLMVRSCLRIEVFDWFI